MARVRKLYSDSPANRLRILYIGFSDSRGGAAIASSRLITRLDSQGAVSPLELVSKQLSRNSWTISFEVAHDFPIWKWSARLCALYNEVSSDPYGWLPFFSGYAGRVIATFNPDVIHCHNLHGGIGILPVTDLPMLSKAAPIVWTLHDMWAFTGHCAYSLGCEGWRRGCGRCPDLGLYPRVLSDRTSQIAEKKLRAYSQADITLVSPSNWLLNLAAQAPLTKSLNARLIRNGVDLSAFRPGSGSEVRERLSIPPSAPVVLFMAESLAGDSRKGGRELRNVLERLLQLRPGLALHVLLVGRDGERLLAGFRGLTLHNIGFISDPSDAAPFYRAADVFLNPSLQDNFPNTLVEAAACGVACVTFDSGGCGEIVIDGITGHVAPNGDWKSFADLVARLLGEPAQRLSMGQAARAHAVKNFSDASMAENYIDLYRDVVAKRRTRRTRD